MVVNREYMFIAFESIISVCSMPNHDMHDRPRDVLMKLNCGSEVNQMKIGIYLGEEILVAVGEDGKVNIWRTCNLKAGKVISNYEESTWSIAISNNFLCVGSNRWEISVWTEKGAKHYMIKGHSHNIPAIDISPCERYLASASIDKSYRVWDLKRGKTLIDGSFQDEWGWCVKWVSKRTALDQFLNQSSRLKPTRDPIGMILDSVHARDNLEVQRDEIAIDEDESVESSESEGWESVEENESEQVSDFVEKDDEIVEDSVNPSKVLDPKLDEVLLFFATKGNMYLLDTNQNIQSHIRWGDYVPIRREMIQFNLLRKISFVEYISDLSLFLCCNAGDSNILLIRLVFADGKYSFFPEMILLDYHVPIAGLSYRSVPLHSGLPRYHVFALMLDGKTFVYELALSISSLIDIQNVIL